MSLKFVNKELFETPIWLIDKDIIGRTEYSGVTERVRAMQVRTLNNILDLGRMMRMIENETLNGANSYSLISMINDLQSGIWSELSTGKNIDTYRRNLQRAYVDRLGYLMTAKDVKPSGRKSSYVKMTLVTVNGSDIVSVARGELNRVKVAAQRAALATTNTNTKYHLQDIAKRVDGFLDPKS
ncbi:MAG: zinc-dependent metalloprotease [Lutibacter sp.]|nr:zinc-dependent metalloprotease [Lutibacter sp.]MDT8417054.1 zinc-dependent metalloprotease [Lutibacter sp.]